MAAKKLDLASLRDRTAEASRGLSAADRDRRQRAAAELLALAPTRDLSIPLERIHARQGGDTRPLNPEHVVALAESIAVLGLIEAIAIDRRERLLAGGHRLFALRLLAQGDPQARLALWQTGTGARATGKRGRELRERVLGLDAGAMARFFPQGVPVRIHDLDAEADPQRALQIEVAENEKRRDYTRDEVLKLITRLRQHGYVIKHGKLKQGEKPLLPELSRVLGKSIRQVQRVLNGTPTPTRKQPTRARSAVAPEVPATIEALLALIDKSGLSRRRIAEQLHQSLAAPSGVTAASAPSAPSDAEQVRTDVLEALQEALRAAQDYLDAEGADLATQLAERCRS
jgi:ParB family chromosome partitioning protein